MYKVLLFAGTTEGRLLARFLALNGAEVCACVATEYGKEILEEQPNVSVRTGRLNEMEMAGLMPDYDCVVDATHPYAEEVTKNIKSAGERCKKEYIRVVRDRQKAGGYAVVGDAGEAAGYLKNTQGNILLATGTKDLSAYSEIGKIRLYPRVLPTTEAIAHCRSLGIPSKNIICMQGPFNMEMNLATLRQVDARFLVTKNSGREGGFDEKLQAAKLAGASVVVIGKTSKETGITLEAAKRLFADRLLLPGQKMFPMFINLAGKKAVVIGGGEIAMRRIRTLLNFGCGIDVISPEITDGFSDLMERVRWMQREYSKGDCQNADLVLAAANNRVVNHSIAEECRELCIPVSVADCHKECTFYFPAIVQQGNFVAGIVSKNCGHTAVKRAAQEIRAVFAQMEKLEDGE